ncbi:PadR family transcriptional regulator [Nonomuraea soli]|uniref:DNA-binding PadR family transcriptional regulator n=1 Tax=Nonomuraea soli TaxID=1032476 RepID=A0A7W0CLR8_9ACTN|nr:helix-turn-helix transcriptional regulator [Nonomuraea soli]MBA2893541.1 DNA-binding PadR family transcriptional regulator [Nonomuraea soli]
MRSRSNPLALAVLALLFEGPMHPYELATTMRERHKEESIKLNYGTLYSVMQSLDKRGLVRVKEVVREGRRPERTIYEITEAGRVEMIDWLSSLIATPAQEFTDFEAGLSLIGVLEPEIVLRLLEERLMRLTQQVQGQEAMYESALKDGLARLLLIEMEYVITLRRAELAWLRELVGQLRDGTLEGLELWREWHRESGETP